MNTASVLAGELTCEYQTNPLGIDVRRPRLSWRLRSEQRDARQSAYQILAASSEDRLRADEGDLWDTGQTPGAQSTLVAYGGRPPRSSERVYWKVRVWDGAGRPSAWSKTAHWEMGLLEAADWQTAWIAPDLAEDVTRPQPAAMLRGEFSLADSEVRSARAYVTSLGLYELALNGRRVGDQVLTPGWTSYNKRLQYQTYDVTAYLHAGLNAAGVWLGDGWYRGYLGWGGRRNVYGDRLAVVVQIVVSYADGQVQVVGTGDHWRAAHGPIVQSDLYNGEVYDARRERPGWLAAGYDDSGWAGVRTVRPAPREVVAPLGPPMRRIEELKPREVVQTPAGETVLDFGQNMVGWVRMAVAGPAGTEVVVRHAEVLDAAGNLYTANLRGAEQTDRYVLRGESTEVFEPRFTFHGFRYVAVENYPGPLSLEAFTGVVVYSDLPATGHFECDRPLINQLQHNIVWGQRGNFLDVPTDCPQRDERMGWTGDAQVFARTAAFNMQVAGFFTKWLRDLAADQYADGRVPHVIPDVLGDGGSTGWADAAVIVPWVMYQAYGDTRLLEEQYGSMQAWVGWMRQQAGDSWLWTTGTHFGDWLAVPTPDPNFPNAVTEQSLLATAYFAYSTGLLARVARVLGKTAEAEQYEGWAARIKEAFNREFVTPNGRITSNTQTAYVLALHFDLLPEEARAQAAQRLADDVRQRGNHLSTGFLGASYLPHVLSTHGHLDLAYALLEQESYPSWLYPITRGATTIWERWDGLKPDGTFQAATMNSFNHYAYGAIGEWLYRVVAGLDVDPEAPGYQRSVIRPRPGGSLERARATHDSLYGRIEAGWTRAEDGLHVEVTIPPNTEGVVYLPAAGVGAVSEGGQPLQDVAGVREAREADGQVVVVLGSGRYQLHCAEAADAAAAGAKAGSVAG